MLLAARAHPVEEISLQNTQRERLGGSRLMNSTRKFSSAARIFARVERNSRVAHNKLNFSRQNHAVFHGELTCFQIGGGKHQNTLCMHPRVGLSAPSQVSGGTLVRVWMHPRKCLLTPSREAQDGARGSVCTLARGNVRRVRVWMPPASRARVEYDPRHAPSLCPPCLTHPRLRWTQ